MAKLQVAGFHTLDPCVHCGHSTAFGSGRYVNRIPVNDGWGCAECSGFECDRCAQQIYLDAEVTPDQCSKTYTVENGVPVFSDGASEVHEACLTETEAYGFQVFESELQRGMEGQ